MGSTRMAVYKKGPCTVDNGYDTAMATAAYVVRGREGSAGVQPPKPQRSEGLPLVGGCDLGLILAI